MFGAISKRKDRMLSVKDYMLLLDRDASWSGFQEDLIAKTRDSVRSLSEYLLQHWTLLKGAPMRLWLRLLDFTTSTSAAFGDGNIESAAPLRYMVGQKACDGGLCLYPPAPSSLCLSSLDHGGKWMAVGWQCQSRVAGQELPWQVTLFPPMRTCLRRS